VINIKVFSGVLSNLLIENNICYNKTDFCRSDLIVKKTKSTKVILIDYSEIYYSVVAGLTVPDNRTGKFVQISHDSTEYLIFSPEEITRYHADIVERFCSERGIAGTYDNTVKRFYIHDPAWDVAGGGKFEIDKTKKHIRLYDNSMAYGRFDTRGLKEKIYSIDEFADFKVQID
jgi:hypothetical protein